MPVETKTTGDDLTKVLATLEGLHARMDSMEVTGKNPLKADGRKDAAAADDGGKKDGEEDKEEKKDEEGEDKDKDKDKEEKEDAKKDEFPPPKDEKKDAKKDERKDEFPPPKDEKKDERKDEFPPKKEGEEKGDARGDARADSSTIAALRRQIADQDAAMKNQGKIIERISAQLKPRTDEEHAAFADAQARADAVFMGFGKTAPRPLEGETLLNYRKRLATHLKPHSTTWKGVKFSVLPDEAFSIAERQVYADAAVAAQSPTDLDDGELRPVTKVDPTTGMRQTVFYGKESFVKSMGQPGRRVMAFNTRPST